MVNFVQTARTEASGLIINAGAYSHTSVAILDALQAVEVPVIEVHLSNIFARKFRHHSYVSGVAAVLFVDWAQGQNGNRRAGSAFGIRAGSMAKLPSSKTIKELAELLSETGLTEIEVETGDMRIKVARQGTGKRHCATSCCSPAGRGRTGAKLPRHRLRPTIRVA